ncbi:MAG: LemA family protein [Alphaproteobacteria bacterium]|nr:LemA family protein [Alphaproteobacteria bacterium]
MEIFIGVIVLITGYLIVIYNALVKKRAMTDEGWSGIDVQLKVRANLIPNIIESVKGYMKHENKVLEELTAMRSKSMAAETVAEQSAAENMMSGALANLFAIAENYPDLKANQSFLDLQSQLSEVEDKIQKARRYYNATARDLNIKVDSFPSNIVANIFHFDKAEYFEIENPEERAVPKVSFE